MKNSYILQEPVGIHHQIEEPTRTDIKRLNNPHIKAKDAMLTMADVIISVRKAGDRRHARVKKDGS